MRIKFLLSQLDHLCFHKLKDSFNSVGRYVRVHKKSISYFTKRALASTKKRSNIIISLSTIPSRIELIDPTLNSLLDQTVRPEKIYLNVPKFSIRENRAYVIPDRLKNHPIIEVVEVDKDWGPATKMIPTLLREADRDTPILVLDDDYVYTKNLVETYVKSMEEIDHAVLCLKGWNLPYEMNHKNKIRYRGMETKDFKRVDLFEGSSSYLVKPSFFPKEMFDYERAPKEAFYCDDIWVSGNLAKSQIPILIMPFCGWIPRLLNFSTRNTIRLATKENRDDYNENCIYRYFEKYWKDLDNQLPESSSQHISRPSDKILIVKKPA